jgi:DNA-damage-inducible protein D
LAEILQYKRWDKFFNAIEKAKEACENSGINAEDHFSHVGKMVELGSNAQREIEDLMLSRYACYLIVQNADPRKEVVALGQTYFAVQTRRQELQDNFKEMDEDRKRMAVRNELKEHNKKLVAAAKTAGVESTLDYAVFQNHGYMGLYGGLKAKDIHERKKLAKSHDILDHMGSTELAANLFRATQTEEKLRREEIEGKEKANKTHFEVGKKVRQTIKELGGTMPEDLPTPEKSIREIQKEEMRKLK